MSDREQAFNLYLSYIGGENWSETQRDASQADFNAGWDALEASREVA